MAARPLLPARPASPSLLGRRAGLLLLALVLVALGAVAAPGDARAETPPAGLGGFDPGNLISDGAMFDGDAMSTAQVQAFLDQRGAGCRTDGVNGDLCLRVYRTDTPARTKTAYCAAIPARTAATAAQVITDVAVACDVSPRVLLVMLQKEQGLVTTTAPTQKKLDQALGFACPDFRGCDATKAGFAQQVYNGGSRLQQYGDADMNFRYRAGVTYDIQYSPYAFCGYGKVTIANRATAALYNYTPYTPTQATLDAGSGAVRDDVCATYGNRNFYRLYAQWFGTPNGRAASTYPVAAPAGKTPKDPFTDVTPSSSIFFIEIAWMKHEGYTTGWPDGTYRPLQAINRDAMAAFLYRAAGSPAYTPPATSPFRDVATTSMYYKEIAWAWSEGITTGWSDGTFRPLEPINRDAMAAFLYRYAGEPTFTAPRTSPFRDVTRSSSIFYEEITWAAATGISTGWSDGTYRPLQSIHRDAMAAFIYRLEVD